MNLTLKLAHDDKEVNRVSALKIMNELASDMGQVLCESYIVPEVRSLSIDESITVRQAVAKNFLNASKIISLGSFSAHIFPMYERLTKDPDEKVRKACAEVIADVSKVSPIKEKAASLQEIYYKYLKDPTSKIVRGTAYQNIGPFIANFKDQAQVDQKIIDFFVTTTEGTSNKDVCYYSAFNLPAFIFVLGDTQWPKFRPIFNKLTRFNEMKIQRTLAFSMHELAQILGPQITETDLCPAMEKFISDKCPFKEVRMACLKNLHIFLQQLSAESRLKFLPYILQTNDSSVLDWRIKLVLAYNIGNFSLLYDEETVYSSFLPIFFRFCFDPVAKVAETASLSLPSILIAFNKNPERQEALMRVIRKYFLASETYKRRQLFVLMCGESLNHREIFYKFFKKCIVAFADDKVISVRMALARVIKQHYVTNLTNSLVRDRDIAFIVQKLQQDPRSADIRQLVSTIPVYEIDMNASITEDNPLLEFRSSQTEEAQPTSTAINDTVDRGMSESGLEMQSGDDLELEIMINDAIDAAQQQYTDS